MKNFRQQYRRVIEIFNVVERCELINEQNSLLNFINEDKEVYNNLRKNPTASNIATTIKNADNYFNDDESYAEFAFNMIPNMDLYGKVKSILVQDPYDFIKSFMDTSKNWYGGSEIVSVDAHMKKLMTKMPMAQRPLIGDFYESLKNAPTPLNIANALKNADDLTNDDEAEAEFAFNMITDMNIYREVAKILGPDPYKFVKKYMDTSKIYSGKKDIISIDSHWKKLQSIGPKLPVVKPTYDKASQEKFDKMYKNELDPISKQPKEKNPEKWSPELRQFMQQRAEIPTVTGKELEDAVSTMGMAFSMLAGVGAATQVGTIARAIQMTLFELGVVFSAAEIYLVDKRGNDYETAFLVAMTILNFDDLGVIFGGKAYSQQFIEESIQYILKGGRNLLDTKYAKLFSDYLKNSKKINELAQTKFGKIFVQKIPDLLRTKPLAYTIGLAGKTLKFSVNLSTITFPIYGSYITLEQIYKALYGNDVEKQVMRELSSVQQLLRMISNREVPENVQREINKIIGGAISKEGNEYIKNVQKAITEAGGYDEFESSLFDYFSEYQLTGKFDEDIKKIGDDFYESIEGFGTNLDDLVKVIRKITDARIFDEVNYYLFFTYKENIYDLLNNEYGLTKSEKNIILWNFAANGLKGYYTKGTNYPYRIWLHPTELNFQREQIKQTLK